MSELNGKSEVNENPENSKSSEVSEANENARQEALEDIDSDLSPSENESKEIVESKNDETKEQRGALLPKNGGEWSGERGNSDWTPDSDVVPGDKNGTNPEHKDWGTIKEEYNFESIPFKDGEPDFSEVSKGDVEIEEFTDDRSLNFDQADEKLAEQKGCSPEDVEQWRKENKYTWHECNDCKTMQKVPTEVHGNISHSGGISEYKSQN